MSRAALVASLAAALCATAAPSLCAAQEWPTRPITLVVPFSPGGGVDISARLQAQAIGDILGQSVVVENIGGGAGMTAGVRVAHAAPDGYTFMIGNAGTHAFTQTLYKKPLYNSVTDFTPVGLVSESPRIVNVRKDLPVKNLQEFMAWLKANEKTAQFGSAGVGTGTHLPCVLFNLAIGVNITNVPYRGAGAIIQDLLGGRIDYMCDTIQTGAQLAKQGSVKPVAVLSAHRGGAGAAGGRRVGVERVLPAQGHAGCDRPQAQRSDQQVAGESGVARAPRRARPRDRAAGAAHAGIPRQVPARGHRALG
jgi:tripartite-type tricarboxylate transporter receptor subunit TctC